MGSAHKRNAGVAAPPNNQFKNSVQQIFAALHATKLPDSMTRRRLIDPA